MCGLTGFAPNKNKKANIDWIKMIMVYNTSRGTDSCGLYINNKVIKGIGTTADARMMLAKEKIKIDNNSQNGVIIGHTRKSSHGIKSLENAHPFRIEHEGRVMWIAHNGTIHNIYELAKKYEVDTTGMQVDSLILGNIMLQRGYDVLNNYKGGAALLWHFEDEPNVLYAFKGASKEFTYKEVEDERPLFVAKTDEGIYISSIIESLECLTNKECFTLQANEVIKITNNKYFEVQVIDREKTNLQVFHQVQNGTTTKTNTPITTGLFQNTMISDNFNNFVVISEPKHLYLEQSVCFSGIGLLPSRGLFYAKGRYYFNDSSNNARLGDDCVKLANGFYDITFDSKNGFCAIATPSVKDTTFYFYEGVIIIVSKIYDFIYVKKHNIEKIKNPTEKIRQLSSFSKHPITYLEQDFDKIKSKYRKFFFMGKDNINYSFVPSFSYRKYELSLGTLKKIYTSNENDSFILDNKETEIDINDPNVFIIGGYMLIRDITKLTSSDLIEEELSWLSGDNVYYFDDFGVSFYGSEYLLEFISYLVTNYLHGTFNSQDDMDIFIDNFYSSNIFNLKDAVKAMFHDIDIDQELEEFTDYFMESVKILEENNIENEKSSNV